MYIPEHGHNRVLIGIVMSNSEIYDPSNSDLSSDEYGTEEDDDALMDAAVCKQAPPPKETKPSSSEAEKAPTQPAIIVELPPSDKSTKPPVTREETLRQIKQIRARKKRIIYYKRRSIRWLRRLKQFPDSKLDALKRALPMYKAHYKRLAEYKLEKAEYLRRRLARRSSSVSSYSRSRSNSRSRSHSRSDSHSRSRSESNSPELICLDDTENEDSPEKVEPVAQTARQMTPVKEDNQKSIPMRQVDFEKHPPPLTPENGSVLDEFLTMKAPIDQVLQQQVGKEMDAYDLAQFSATMKQLTEIAQPKEEAAPVVVPTEPLKRRRSVTPPPLASSQDKRSKQEFPDTDDDDEGIEFIPVVQAAPEPPIRAVVTQQQYLQPPMQRPQHPPVQEKTQQQQPQPLIEKPQPQQHLQPQIQPQILSQMSVQMQMPRQQPMLIKRKAQQPQQHHPQPLPQQTPPRPQHPQQQQQQPQLPLQQKPQQDPRMIGFKLSTPYSLAPGAGAGPGAIQQAVNLTAMAYSLNTPSPPAVPMEISYPTAKLPQTAANPVNLQMPTQAQQPRPPPLASPQPQPHPQQQPLPQAQTQTQTFAVPHQPKPRRSETVSTQTTQAAQTTQPTPQNLNQNQNPPTAQNAPPLPRPKAPPVDLGNPDANFHYHLRSLYEEMDTQLKSKISQVKPELKVLAKERERVEFEIKSLDKQIKRNEDECNRLHYLRLVQNELRVRLQVKERVAIIQSLVPSLLSQNSSFSELREMQSMLGESVGPDDISDAVDRCLDKMEQNKSNMELIRTTLGVAKAPKREPTASSTLRPAPQHFEELLQQRSRNSLPAMRPRRGSIHDINDLYEQRRQSVEDRHIPSSSLEYMDGRHSQAQVGASFSQRLPKSPSLEFLAARQGQGQAPPHHRSQSSLQGQSGIETLMKPLYNSSPLAHLGPPANRNREEMHSNYNNESYSSGGERQQMQRIARSLDNYSRRPQTGGEGAALMNGQGNPFCVECGRNEAKFMCSNCFTHWYCSEVCQLRAWDAHAPLCGQ
ncbi:Hypothetical predicted protein [Drosophila guanche]|uniref:MYND-type domain-containing protein n=3 Tax=Drosophila guanche TaxID=7266 RepID=A0A3B0KPJ0_DROGU|nr:Hypothetical predicted protein [Drosophila guanche]